jgi:hypothetical protein
MVLRLSVDPGDQRGLFRLREEISGIVEPRKQRLSKHVHLKCSAAHIR